MFEKGQKVKLLRNAVEDRHNLFRSAAIYDTKEDREVFIKDSNVTLFKVEKVYGNNIRVRPLNNRYKLYLDEHKGEVIYINDCHIEKDLFSPLIEFKIKGEYANK